jgi:hypothetical protein
MTTPAGSKLGRILSDYALGEALVTAGLAWPRAIEQAEDAEIEEAVGSENLAAVRVAFPADQE